MYIKRKEVKIADFEIGKGKTFIIAELSANHNHDIEVAKKTIKAAKRAGADAIKLQTYTADTITLDCRKDDFILNQGTIWDGKTLYDLYKEAFTPWEWHEELFKTANEEGLICFSSPFDKTAVDLLESLNTPAYKIASFEISDISLIEYTASKQKPMLISTGIANEADIWLAVNACHRMKNHQVILLKTTSQYPAKIEDAKMAMVPDLARRFNVVPGLSDHTVGIVVPVVATTLGAQVIEKHFIFDRTIGGPDASFSLDENEFSEMVKAVRDAELAIGEVNYNLSEKALKSKQISRSLYVVKDVKKGDILTEENIRSIRPGFGMHPKHYSDVLGKYFSKDIEKGTRLTWEIIE